MTALSTARKVVRLAGGNLMNAGIAADAVCIQGGMAMLASGYARPARAGQGGDNGLKAQDVAKCRVVGYFLESKTGTAADGGATIDIGTDPVKFANSSSTDEITVADIGFECFAVDDQTVARTSSNGTRPVAGTVVAIDTDGGVFVAFEPAGATRRRKLYLPFAINETDTLAGTSAELVAPVSGEVTGLTVIVQKAVTTGGDVTVKVGTTDVAGLTCTIADAATKGTVVSDTPTAGDASCAVAAGGRIQVVPAAAFNTAGAVSGFVEISF
ncbi:hypothetical protein ACFQ1E_07990 [Sphingomonas canadensis]|uniref:Uncharacterized protein n=1 Tax=Sphingomonas canadensis TaxID=1219257 RepID=A0ABW3H533_9SPHN|nr:hypothetical protein [Sphingomonas canadensis]MCW3835977.1 hypothetical protein [Sphingomonas canadensis]